MRKITVTTCISRNSNPYAELLKKSLEYFKSGIIEIEYNCVLSDGSVFAPDGWHAIGNTSNNGHDCYNHAKSLNLAYEDADSPVNVIVDCDMCVLYEDWDILAWDMCRGLGGIFGTAYRNGSNYQQFPNIFFFAYPIELRNKASLDFSPLIGKNNSPVRMTINKKLRKCDTGYSIPEACVEAGFASTAMVCIEQLDKDALLGFCSDEHKGICLEKPSHMAEWHYGKRLFCTHKQASRNHPLDHKYGQAWKKKIDKFTFENYGVVL